MATRTRFRPDRGLTLRMGLTMFLLGLLYVVFAVVLTLFLKSLVLIVAIVAGLLFAQYWFADRLALFAMHARIVTESEEPELHAALDRLCALADMPKPRVAIVESDTPNAFATGRNAASTVVCTSRGLLARLDTEELAGVLAHELSHVAHRDVVVMTVASFLGVLAGLITRFAFYSGLFGGFGDRRGGGDDRDNTGLVILVVMGASAVVYAISFVLIRTLSRYRELAADRSGALLTGRPDALGSALVKVSGDLARIPTRDLRDAEPFNAFFFAPALAPGASLSSLFSTHPSLQRRLDQLGEIADDLAKGA